MRLLSLTILTLVLSTLAAGALSGCSALRHLGVYQIDINQGNYLTKDMVAKLKVGQTAQQVTAILGTPLLEDPFHAHQWNYVYTYTKNGAVTERRKFVVLFDDDMKVSGWKGDEPPISEIELNREARAKALPPSSAR
jgi:outer membrane protein assembly factor BamE